MPNPRATRNLFDVKLGPLELEDEWDLLSIVGSATELDLSWDQVRKRSPEFPLILESTTPNDLLTRFLRMHPTHRVRIDRPANRIQVETKTRKPCIERAKDWLRRLTVDGLRSPVSVVLGRPVAVSVPS